MKRFTYLIIGLLSFASCTKTPEACFTYLDQAFVIADHQFSSCSSDAEYQLWVFGDGEAATGNSVVHRYDAAGDYEIQLKAYSDDGKKEDVKRHYLSLSHKVVDSVKVRRLDIDGTVDLKLSLDNSSASETYTVTWRDLPVMFRFPAGVKLYNAYGDFNFTEGVANDEVQRFDARMHHTYDNPQLIEEGSYRIEVYWHFE